MGGVRSFFIESKFFQLILEEGGRFYRLQIFERGKFFMRSVFMGKNAAQWLMSNLEHLVVGVNPKHFFTLREGDTAFTLQRSSNTSGQFLLLTELKAGGSRRSIILPVGKERNGWRVFGLELRKLLNPSLYAVEGFGLPKFIPQLRRSNLEAQNHGTYAEVVQGFHGRSENGYEPFQPRVTVKGKSSKQIEEELGVNPRVSKAFGGESLVEKQGRKVIMGEARREKGYLEMVVADTRTSLPRGSLNSKDVGNRKKGVAGSNGWSGRSLVVEVDGTGRRRVSWESRKGGVSKGRNVSREVAWESAADSANSLKWIPKGVDQEASKIGLGLGKSPLLTDPPTYPFLPTSSGPRVFEVGEASVDGKGGLAQAPARYGDEIGESARCASSKVVADGPALVGLSSGEPSSTPEEVEDLPCADSLSLDLAVTSVESDGSGAAGNCFAGNLSVGFAVSSPEDDGSGAAGNSSDGLVGKADGHPDADICSDEPTAPREEFEVRMPTGTNSGVSELMSSSEYSFSDLKLCFSRTGIDALGVTEGDGADLDRRLMTDDFDVEQLRNVESPLKALCAVSGMGNLEEENFNFSDSGLGEEECSPIPLLSISPIGLPLTVENCVMEAVGSESILDASSWVKNRLPGFCKLVGLPMNRHEKLCIALLQKIEKETTDAKAMHKKDTPTRKMVIFKDKGKRELRNLLSSVNYDGR